MKLAVWNVERLPSRPRRDRVLAVIESVAADVWILTETRAGFTPGTDYKGFCSGTPDEPERAGEVWAAIWSRYPMDKLGPTSDAARSVAALIQPPTGAPLLVYATVLPWVGSQWRGRPGRGGEAFGAALDAQAADWLRLKDEHPAAELCVAGDLNQDLSDHHYYGSTAGRQQLICALESAGLRSMTAYPTDPVRAVAPDRASIDHICVPKASTRWRDDALEVWPQRPAPDRLLSDHYGVAVISTDHPRFVGTGSLGPLGPG